MGLRDNAFFRTSAQWTGPGCCQAVFLSLLVGSVSDVMAENGQLLPAADQAHPSYVAELSNDIPTRLVPKWTEPQRAPVLSKAVAAELAHAEELGTPYGETGSVATPVEQPSMIDVVGAGLFISPITDENYQPSENDAQPLKEKLPEAVSQARKMEDWTTAARIVVHSPDKDDRLPSKLNELLRASGASSIENHEVDMTVARDHIRFYHPSDHMYAIEVAAALDGVLETLLVKDFSFMRPQPPRGLVEIWLR